MKRETAIKLLHKYQGHFAWQDDPVLTGLADRLPADASTEKVMRWLGFAQGCAYMLELFDLEELKEHSRQASIND